jgi:hypothetical protein
MHSSSFLLYSLEEIFIRSWWVALFLLGCYLCYNHGQEIRNQDFDKLHVQYLELQKERARAYALRESLTLQVNSQSDPEWVELTLMKGLGLVPEGSTKVIFVEK